MKVFFCVNNTSVDALKDKPSQYKTSKIKTKFAKGKNASWREFTSVENIEYVALADVTGSMKLKLAGLYDKIMYKELFSATLCDLNHLKMFEEYKEFNAKFVDLIKDKAGEDDLIIVNDSSLFLLPSLTPARVVFRNLRFDGNYIERVPFYREIVKNLCLCQKFFDSKESMESFNEYMLTSYEMRDTEKGGCWFLKPYVDKFIVIDTLEHLVEFVKQQTTNPGFLFEKTLPKRYSYRVMSYFYNFPCPKIRKYILTDANLINIEPFIKRNPHVHVRYLRTTVDLDEESHRMIEYLKKMYGTSFSVADTSEYFQIVAEMFYCDMFVGSQHMEIAQLFGRPVIEESYDPFKLAEDIEQILSEYYQKKYNIIGEEEYLKEFLGVNGYEMVINMPTTDDEAIDRLSEDLCRMLRSHGQAQTVYYKRVDEEEEEALYIKKGTPVHFSGKASYYPVLFGDGSYRDLKYKIKPKELLPLDREKLKPFWKASKRVILLDYDGVLTPIVNDRNAAVLAPDMKEILLELAKTSRVVICSGRTRDKLDEWIPKEIEVYGEHGLLHRVDGKWEKRDTGEDIVSLSREIMQYYAKRTPGAEIEEKEGGITFHYRNTKKFCVDKLYTLLRKVGGERVDLGKMVVDVKASRKDYACQAVEPDICIGDDKTDEDMFKICNGISIKVGRGLSYADCYVEDVPAVAELLRDLTGV